MSNELIYKQDAIDALGERPDVWTESDYERGCANQWDYDVAAIQSVPSAQPEQRPLTEDDYGYCTECDHVEMCRWYPMYGCEFKSRPPAQPESLTDKEQRIFLAAMGREEKVCEEVDRNCVREPYEDSLVRVCKEIRRKVKGALWI